MLSFWLSSVSGLSNSRTAPLFRTITRSALRMVCTRCWVDRRSCCVWWAGQPRYPVLPQPGGGHYASAPPPFLFSGSSDRPEANYVAKDKLELLFSFPEC